MKIRKRDLPQLTARGWIIAVLVAASAAISFIVSAVSLTRIAAELLGFPDGLPWTFTGAVDVGAAAGAVMWVTSPARHPNRTRGMLINVCCSVVSAIGVGLDHVSHSDTWIVYQVTAFAVGAFLPALSTWLVHVLAHLVTEAAESAKVVRGDSPAADRTTSAPKLAAVPMTKRARRVNDAGPDGETPEERRRRLDADRKRRARAAARERVTA